MKKEWSDHAITPYDTSASYEINRDARWVVTDISNRCTNRLEIAFEVDPPSVAYQNHFHQLKSDWQDGDVVTLEFDGERMQAAGFEILQSSEDVRNQQAERLGVSIEEIGSYAFIRNFVSLDYLIESSREKISEYY